MQELRPFNYDSLPFEPQLRYSGVRIIPTENPPRIAVPVDNNGILSGVMLSLHFETETEHYVLGSAVLVAPGVAISAHHVFLEHDSHPSEFEDIIAIGHHESESFLWGVETVIHVQGTDLVLISLRLLSAPPAEGVLRVAQLTDREPDIREMLFLGGYRATEATPIIAGHREVFGDVFCCGGPLLRAFPKGRDSVVISFPAFEVDFAAPGRISGGPVFDSEGRLCGVLSTSMSEGPAYVSMLWPALNVVLGDIVPDGFLPEGHTLRDFLEYQKGVDGRSS